MPKSKSVKARVSREFYELGRSTGWSFPEFTRRIAKKMKEGEDTEEIRISWPRIRI